MNVFKNVIAAAVITIATTTAAVAGQPAGFVSVENVISQDKQVSRIQRSLTRDNFEVLNTATSAVQYIVQPTEAVYQTSKTVITMVGTTEDAEIEYADLHVTIMYNGETNTYSAGDVSVKYKSAL